MKIFSIAVNMHDHNTYDGKFHHQIDRYSRIKHNINYKNPSDPKFGREFFLNHFLPNYKKPDSILAFTASGSGQEFVDDLFKEHVMNNFLMFRPRNLWDRCQTDTYYYIDHHQSHAAYAFLSSGFKDSDILAIDGRGWHYNCIFVDRNGTITDLSSKISIGGLWNLISQHIDLGFLGAGKVMGLAGFGKYDADVHMVIDKYLENPIFRLPDGTYDIIKNAKKEDVAFTMQYVTIKRIQEFVYPLKSSDNICVAGGVAYNGYMNEELTKHYKLVHVPPAPGDEGQSIGTYMHADYVLNKNVHRPNVYAGADHYVDPSIFEGLVWENKSIDLISTEVATAIANGKIVGWYQGKSESGNRALGNRSILADPRNPNIKDIINSTIKLREDFRPFAPSVLEDHYKEFFDANQPSPFMSRIVRVKSDKIPGVTHIDGTSRIQTVSKAENEKYYNLINEFFKITGIPMLLNTSFNCQEPIVETPQHAVNTFKKCGLDILVINDYIIKKKEDNA